jgi:predicted nuclease with TOPRIM domain
MSRWIEQYQNHPFHNEWTLFKENLDLAKIDDETIVTSVNELTRLRKVVSFLDGLLNSIDPELVPLTTWGNFSSQLTSCNQQLAAFNTNRNIIHLQEANNHADNLLSYVRPYMVIGDKVGKILQDAVKQYSKTLDEYSATLESDSIKLVKEIKNRRSQTEDLYKAIETVYNEISQFKAELVGDEQVSDSVKSKINELVSSTEKQHLDISKLHKEIFTGDDTNLSTKLAISQAKEKILFDSKEIETLLEKTTNEINQLDIFHVKIFGKVNNQNQREGALSEELDKQSIRYKALNEKIEGLIPGATSAGLATAYKDLKESFDEPIKNVSNVFYISIGLLLFSSLLLSINNIGSNGITFVKFENWDAVFKGLVNKIPFYAPVLWLAFFASKRRSEYQRLQQEYAHKEALAKSYDKYKKQIEELDDEDKTMQKEFIMKAVDAIAYNASQTLDKKHGDNLRLRTF